MHIEFRALARQGSRHGPVWQVRNAGIYSALAILSSTGSRPASYHQLSIKIPSFPPALTHGRQEPPTGTLAQPGSFQRRLGAETRAGGRERASGASAASAVSLSDSKCPVRKFRDTP